MKKKIVHLWLFGALLLFLSVPLAAQTGALIKRTTYKTETINFGVGGTVTIAGAPNGSISIEGWQKNEVEISADIEMQAATEADLAELAKVNGFVIDEGFGHIRIMSIGTHDKNYMKRTAKKFPKHLLEMPLRIDYRIKVPIYCDLQVDGGRGDLNLSNVEGAIRLNFLETNAKLNLVGGTFNGTFGSGIIEVLIPNSSWRGRSADVQLASGNLNVQLPPNFNAFLDAKVLRGGQIENNLTMLKPRERTKFTEKSISAKAGNGGASMNFTVGDGTLKITERGI